MNSILRHFSSLENLPPLDTFDAFVAGQGIATGDPALRDLASSRPGWRYFNALHFGAAGWKSDWYDWESANIPPLKNSLGVHALAWFDRRLFYDWPKLAYSGKLDEMVALQVSLTQSSGCQGIFLDQVWAVPRDWMFHQDGARYDSFPAGYWTFWRRAVKDYFQKLSALIPVMWNAWEPEGIPISQDPVYCERSEWAWSRRLTEWRQSDRNVLSVSSSDPVYVARAIKVWLAEGRWIAFTGDSPDFAYYLAAEMRT